MFDVQIPHFDLVFVGVLVGIGCFNIWINRHRSKLDRALRGGVAGAVLAALIGVLTGRDLFLFPGSLIALALFALVIASASAWFSAAAFDD
jgi:hypothetical protein